MEKEMGLGGSAIGQSVGRSVAICAVMTVPHRLDCFLFAVVRRWGRGKAGRNFAVVSQVKYDLILAYTKKRKAS